MRNSTIVQIVLWILSVRTLKDILLTHIILWHGWLVVRPLSGLTLQWRHNERDGVLNQQHFDCLFSRLFRRTSKKTKLASLAFVRVHHPLKAPVTRKMISFDDVIMISVKRGEWPRFLCQSNEQKVLSIELPLKERSKYLQIRGI